MNIQIAPGMNVLATCETLTALDIFVEGAPEKLVTRLEEYVRSQPVDMSTTKGRDAIRSLAAKVSRTKTGLDDLGKDHVAELKKQTGAIDAQRKLIRDRLDALRDEVRNPLTVFEEAEANRVAEHERLLVLLAGAAVFNTVPSAAEIDDRLAKLTPFTGRNWEEFGDRASEGYDDALNKLNGFREAAVVQEAAAIELIELRKQAAEYEAEKAAMRIAAEAAENERIRVEQEKIREANMLAAQARRETELAEQAVRDAEGAAAKAVEDERKRVAKIAADEAASVAKLERNKKHREKVHKEIARAINQALNGAQYSPERLVEAIAAGIIPHVSITY